MSPSTNKTAILRLLAKTTDLSIVREIVAPSATYVSLAFDNPAFDNPELKAIKPWCGTHKNVGPEGIHKVFVDVNQAWEIHWALADGKTNEVAVFGRFRFVSRGLGKVTDSPFALLARFGAEGKVIYMQFMEDTLSTAGSLR